MKFETVSQAAARMGVTVRAVQKWAKEGKLEGAQKMGRDWMIPFGAVVTETKADIAEVETEKRFLMLLFLCFSCHIFRAIFLNTLTKSVILTSATFI